MIRFEQVGKRYPNGHVGLHEVPFRVHRDKILLITGHSGAGKSTPPRLILAMERPISGKLLPDGQDLGRIITVQIPFLRRQIDVMFQNRQLFTDRIVANNIALLSQILDIPRPKIARRVVSALKWVNLEERGGALPSNLSTGQQQWVGVARAIVHQPALLLAGEPAGNLGPRLASEIMDVFGDIDCLSTIVLIASHGLALIARVYHRMLILQRGRVTAGREDEA